MSEVLVILRGTNCHFVLINFFFFYLENAFLLQKTGSCVIGSCSKLILNILGLCLWLFFPFGFAWRVVRPSVALDCTGEETLVLGM